MAGSSAASKLLNPVNPALRNIIRQNLIRPSATAAAHIYQPTQESPKSPSIQINDFIGDSIRRSTSSAINVNLGNIPSVMPMGLERSYYPNAGNGKVVVSQYERSDSEFEDPGADDDSDDEVGDFDDSDFDDENDEDEDGSGEDSDDVDECKKDPFKEVADEPKKSPSRSRK